MNYLNNYSLRLVYLDYMFFFLLFILELFLLFFLSKKLVNSLARVIYRFTKHHKIVVHTLALIFLPGTIVHELAHLLFAGIMFVPVGEINVVPQIEEKGVRLGSVQIGRTDPFRRMVVGVAPVLLGMILIFSIFLLIKIGASPWWQTILALYLIFEIGNTMFSSRKDIEGSLLFITLVLVLLMVILLGLYFLTPGILQSIWFNISQLNLEFMVNFFKQAASYLTIPLALDVFIIFLSRLLF